MDRQDPAWIAQEYQRRRLASILWRLVIIPLAIGVGVTLPRDGGKGMTVLMLALVAGLLLSLWRLFVVWRCPACNKGLGRELHTRHCPNCGVRLEL